MRKAKSKYQGGGLYKTNRKGYVDSVLSANKNLEWVNRLYDKNPQTLQLPGEKYPSTHFMEESDGKVYPTIVNINGKLVYLGDKARDYADSTNTAIKFPDEKQALWFAANGYKMGTGVLPKKQMGGIDLQSILGYSQGSPFAGNPYLDIHTPEGLIDMSNTPIDLIGIDNKGNKKKMKAWRKNPYKFEGDVVREIRQDGGIFGAQIGLPKKNPEKITVNPDTLYLPKGSYLNYSRQSSPNRSESIVEYLPGKREELGFLKNWLNSPSALQRMEKLVGKKDAANNIKNGLKNIDNTLIFRDSGRLNDILEYTPTQARVYNDDTEALKLARLQVLFAQRDAAKSELEYLSKPTYTAGFYQPSGQLININNEMVMKEKDSGKGTIVHEFTHASGLDKLMDNYTPNYPSSSTIADKMFKGVTFSAPLKQYTKNKVEQSQKDKEYLKDDTFYPRIMEMRFNSNLKPNETITPERFKQIKEQNPKNDLFRYYGDDDIIWMLNNLVKNSSKNSNNSTAQLGGMRGNPYKISSQNILNYLYDNNENAMDEPKAEVVPEEEKKKPEEQDNSEELQKLRDEAEYNMAIQIAMALEGNPYTSSGVPIHQSEHPFRAKNEDLYSASKQLEGLKYGFGNDGQNGKIDCSGAVCKILNIPRTTSEEIVSNASNFRQFTGDMSSIKEGTVIGINSGYRPWEGPRKYGIDHVLIVVKNPMTGKLETKSSSGSMGFHTEPLEQSLKTYGKYNIYLGDYK